MRVLIVEDETAAVDNLEYLLYKVDRAIEIATVTESVEQTQQWLMQNHADLKWMDPYSVSHDLNSLTRFFAI